MDPVWPVMTYMELGYVFEMMGPSIRPVGSLQSVIGIAPPESVPIAGINQTIEVMTSSGVEVNTLFKGTASTLFPQAPSATTRIEVRFSSRNSAYGIATGIAGEQIKNPIELVKPIQAAWDAGYWRPEYYFVFATARSDASRFYFGKERDTNLLLDAGADLEVGPAGRADLAVSVGLSRQSKAVVNRQVNNAIDFYRAYTLRGDTLLGVQELTRADLVEQTLTVDDGATE